MGLFDRFRRKPAPIAAPVPALPAEDLGAKRVTLTGDAGWSPVASAFQGGEGAWQQHDERGLVRVYRKLDIVQMCVNELAQSFCSAPLVVSTGYKDARQDFDEHPALGLFYRNAAYSVMEIWRLEIARLYLTGASFNLLGLYQDMFGAGAFTPLPTHRVKRIMRGPAVEGYEISKPGGAPLKLKPEEVAAILFPDPANFGGYVSPLQAAARAVNTDQQRQDTTHEVMKNKVLPGLYLGFEDGKGSSKAQRDELKESFDRAAGSEVGNRGRTVLLPPGIRPFPGVDVKDIDFSALCSLTETRICGVFQVPPILVGLWSGLQRSTFSNYAEARKAFYSETIKPLWSYVAEALTRSAILGDDRLYFRFDDSEVKELQEDRSAAWTRATSAYSAGLVTRDEGRAEMGLSPAEDGSGTEFKAPAPSPFGPGGDYEDLDEEGKSAHGHIHGKSLATSAIGYYKNARALKDALSAVFAKQAGDIERQVMAGKFEGFALDDKAVADACRGPLRQIWEAEMRGKLRKVRARWTAKSHGTALEGKAVQIIGSFDVVRQEALQQLERQLFDLARNINGTTGQKVQEAIDEVIRTAREENTVPALQKAISGVFAEANDSRARMIAVTESSRATHDGATFAAVKSGVVKSFEFLASGDCCDICAEHDGKIVTLEEAKAEIGSYERKLPPIHPRCRCTYLENLIDLEDIDNVI